MSTDQLADTIHWDEQGLVPAIVQDAVSKDVLMLAYMNSESLGKTLETGQTWFWSRSRGALWHKGETSGHTQTVQTIRYDCDADTLLVMVYPDGPACHNGTYSCFNEELPIQNRDNTGHAESEKVEQAASLASRFAILSDLETIIAKRHAELPEGAYTTYLFNEGIDKILKKVGEETAEVIIAAKNRDNEELTYETSDLIFHLLVLMRESRLPLDHVLKELKARHVQK